MNLLPVSNYLTEFSQSRERPQSSLDIRRAPEKANDSPVAERVQQSFERGVAEGRSTMKQEMEALLVKEREAFAASLAHERNTWVESQSAVLCRDLEAGLRRVEEQIAGTVASILHPFLDENIRVKAMQELERTLKELFKDREGGSLKIKGSGPADLVERLSNAGLCPEMAGAELEAGGTEMMLSVSETLVETRMNAWIGGLRQVDQ